MIKLPLVERVECFVERQFVKGAGVQLLGAQRRAGDGSRALDLNPPRASVHDPDQVLALCVLRGGGE